MTSKFWTPHRSEHNPYPTPASAVFASQLPGWVTLDPASSPLEVYSHTVTTQAEMTPVLVNDRIDVIMEQLCGDRLVAVAVREPIQHTHSMLTLTITPRSLPAHTTSQVVLDHAFLSHLGRSHCGSRAHITRHGPAALEWMLFRCTLDSTNELSTWSEDTHVAIVECSLFPSHLPLEVSLYLEVIADASKISWDEFAFELAAANLPDHLGDLVNGLVFPPR